MHGKILVDNQQYQKNIHDYHLVKNMNSSLKKITVTVIDAQWIKGAKDMVMVYANNLFIKLTDWFYIRYIQITPKYLMNNQDEMQATYNVE